MFLTLMFLQLYFCLYFLEDSHICGRNVLQGVKVLYSPTNAQMIVLKTVLKFILK